MHLRTPHGLAGGVGLCTLLGYLVRVEGLGSLIPTKTSVSEGQLEFWSWGGVSMGVHVFLMMLDVVLERLVMVAVYLSICR
jgi:hypothetical protein